MKSIHTLCPYLAVPLSLCHKVNGEHILASALGTPESFKIDADESENQRLNVELDVPILRSKLLQLLAIANGVISRSGKDFVVLSGALPSGHEVRVKLAPGTAEFSTPNPVDKDPISGKVTGIKGFDHEVKYLADKVLVGMRRRGLEVETSVPQLIDSTTKVSMELNLNLLLRFMCRTAYLMTVATLGDAAISSQSGVQYRRAINSTDLTHDNLLEIGIGGGFLDLPNHPIQFTNPHKGGHTLACVTMSDLMVSHVVLFNNFVATFITPNPNSDSEEHQSLVFFIDPAKRTYSKTDFQSEFLAMRAKVVE